MSSNDRSTNQGNEVSDEKQSNMVARLAEELDGALDLRNTEDVNQDTTYAPPVTQEVVKPIVHESIKEHITRDTHTHDVYTKILPVRDVEVLPARHWMPGPDGRLVQVDEKDVYSGAAWNQGQLSQSQGTRVDGQQETFGQVAQPQVGEGQSQYSSHDTITHTSFNHPKVIPGQVNQIYQTQTHQYEVGHQIPRKSIGEDHITFAQTSVHQPSGIQSEVNPNQVNQLHQTQSHRHPAVQHEINRYQPSQGQTNTLNQSTANQTCLSQPQGAAEHIRRRQANQPQVAQTSKSQGHHHATNEQGNEGLIHRQQTTQVQTDPAPYQRQQGTRQTDRNAGHQGQFMDLEQTKPVSQTQQHQPLTHDQHAGARHGSNEAQAHQVNHDNQLSPGLLDPYRVKNGPTNHEQEADLSSKPLPDLPETHVQKIAGHKILTTDDKAGHTRLHKEPKEANHS